MTDLAEDIFEVATGLKEFKPAPKLASQMEALGQEAVQMGRAWSGSSLGYHARVYTVDLKPPVGNTRFSAEWGLIDALSNPTQGYKRFDAEYVRAQILKRAGGPDLAAAKAYISDAADKLQSAKDSLASLFTLLGADGQDEFIATKLREFQETELADEGVVLQSIVPTGSTISRDMEAVSNGRHAGAHHKLRALALLFDDAGRVLASAAKLCDAMATHLVRKRRNLRRIEVLPTIDERPTGKHVFIGHGRSELWRDLRDFVRDRLGLDYDEFNRVPVAGKSNKERLTEMLDSAEIALIVMTGEDETSAGESQPRMNVVHEAGLFQGRLGFSRAILLVEQGCKDFSNIDGLGQIRFPKGDISGAFEEVRRVFEAEGIIESPKRKPPPKLPKK